MYSINTITLNLPLKAVASCSKIMIWATCHDAIGISLIKTILLLFSLIFQLNIRPNFICIQHSTSKYKSDRQYNYHRRKKTNLPFSLLRSISFRHLKYIQNDFSLSFFFLITLYNNTTCAAFIYLSHSKNRILSAFPLDSAPDARYNDVKRLTFNRIIPCLIIHT